MSQNFRDRVEISIENHVAHVEMIREDKLNALDSDMFDALIEAARWLEKQAEVRVAVLSGRGRMFCAGLDFMSFAAMAEDDPAKALPLEERTHGLCNKPQFAAYAWHELPVPVIAAIRGGALGGGLQVALGADIRIASEDAKIAIAETQWGLVPDMSGFALARRLLRDDVLRQLTYTAQRIDGNRACALGLITETAQDPLERAFEIARQIAARSPSAIRGSKRLINGLDDQSSSEILLAESREQGAVIGKPHQVEAVMANLEKREPVFD